MKQVAVILPTYNEKENIENIITQIFTILPNAHIVVVDDHSPDGTTNMVKTFQIRWENLHLIERHEKGGRGSAVIAGFSYAFNELNADIFVEMDVDFSHDPKELLTMVSLSNSRSIIVASRYVKNGKIINSPISRKIVRKISNIYIRRLLKLPLKDNTSGYRCYGRTAIGYLLRYNLKSSGYILISETAYILHKNGFKFIEIPTVFRNRQLGTAKGTVKELTHGIKMLFAIRKHKAINIENYLGK